MESHPPPIIQISAVSHLGDCYIIVRYRTLKDHSWSLLQLGVHLLLVSA